MNNIQKDICESGANQESKNEGKWHVHLMDEN
jgi:hypothetical protein